MGLSRKDFFKSAAGMAAIAGGLKGINLNNTLSAKTLTGTRMGLLYDSSKCIGCRHCEEGCIKENNLPKERTLGKLSETSWTAIQTTRNSDGKNMYLKLQCMHCADASCVSVCPTGAAAHNGGGSVVIDQDVCIGCGYCEKACPYGVPHKEEDTAAKKCTFCSNHDGSVSKTACAKACPIGATTYGVREDLLVTANKRVQNLKNQGWPKAQLYGENELSGLGMMYILLESPDFYGLSEKPRQATKNLPALWGGGGLAAAALIAPFWYLYKRISEKDKKLVKKKEGA
jgi:formate dehydrogenase iron-sulfur subunit